MSRTRPQFRTHPILARSERISEAHISRSKAFQINRLPDHILADILLLVPRRIPNTRCHTVAHTLSTICRHWRRVSLSTPRLWDFVPLAYQFERLSVHLARSGSMPLDVLIDLEGVDDIHPQILEESLKLLKNEWSRIRRLSIQLDDLVQPSVVLNAFDITEVTMNDVLEEFSLSFIPEDEEVCVDRYHHFMHEDTNLPLPISQKLHRVALRGVYPFLAHQYPTNTFTGLRDLDIQFAGAISLSNDLFHLLEFVPSLVRLAILFCTIEHDAPELQSEQFVSLRSILLPALTTLNLIDINSTKSVNTILQTIDAPNLRYFSFATDFVLSLGGTMKWPAISRYQALEKIELGGYMGLEIKNLLASLGNLHNLQRLELFRPDDFGRGNNIPTLLASRLTNPSYCPKLIKLLILYPIRYSTFQALQSLKPKRPSLYIDAFLDDNSDTYDSDNYDSESDQDI